MCDFVEIWLLELQFNEMDSQCDPLNSSFKLNGPEREVIGSLSKFEFPKRTLNSHFGLKWINYEVSL